MEVLSIGINKYSIPGSLQKSKCYFPYPVLMLVASRYDAFNGDMNEQEGHWIARSLVPLLFPPAMPLLNDVTTTVLAANNTK